LTDSSSKQLSFTVLSDTQWNSAAIDNVDFPNLNNSVYYYTVQKKLKQVIEYTNQRKPDALLHLGDVTDGANYDASFDMFMADWNRIDPSVKKSLVTGNHDYFAVDMGYEDADYVASKLGYGNNTLIAGSKFNDSFSVTSQSGLSARFIGFDSNLKIDGIPDAANPGWIQEYVSDWIKSELLACEEKIAVIYSHHNTATYADGYAYFESALQDVRASRPDLKMYVMFGHTHVVNLTQTMAIGSKAPIINIPSLSYQLSGKYFTFTFNESGLKSIETFYATY